ncbi:MAG: prolyl-tRNA synthetase [Microgenomates group bacterium Gr01-1014_93]|nr:MAG: prolyl-tRNA synthetase [Microgenomates group bacterium Gr01-1014_93]
MAQVKQITKKSEDISGWYNDVIEQSKLVEHGPVRGTMIWRPKGFALWEAIQKNLNIKIKDLGAESVYFPLFIPESFLKKEKAHVKGFSPELAVVTHGGGEKLTEPIIVRPTSETIMYDAFSRWIESYNDLPLVINQWANVVRWEKRPYFFLRTTEFLWQEGHSAHETNEEAEVLVEKALNLYIDFYRQVLGIYGYAGRKSESEKFPGADSTFTYEMLMPDGKVVQGCTSHNLGQNFAKVFKVEFTGKTGKRSFVHQTSWGLSSRSIGAMILAHGDDNGLVLPPEIAPVQVVIIPILTKSSEKNKILSLAGKTFIKLEQANIRVKLDDSESSPGWKFNQYDLEGVPLRIEIGLSELNSERLKVVRRDTKDARDIHINVIEVEIENILREMQVNLLDKSRRFTEKNTRQADNYKEFNEIMNTTRGFIEAFWCESASCEAKIKEETKATTRCLPIDSIEASGQCIYCGKSAKNRWLFG